MKKTLTREDAALEISQRVGCAITLARRFLDTSIDVMSDALLAGRKVEFRNFGVFRVVKRKPRVGRNPKEPEAGRIEIPSKLGIKFKTSPHLEKKLK